MYEEAVSGFTASNTQLFRYFLWEYHLLTPTLSGTLPGHKTRPWYILRNTMFLSTLSCPRKTVVVLQCNAEKAD
jgi:hypothetical protein